MVRMLRRETRRMGSEDAGYCLDIAQTSPGVFCIAKGLAAQPAAPHVPAAVECRLSSSTE